MRFKGTVPAKWLALGDQVVFSAGAFVLTLGLARLFQPAGFGLYSTLVLALYFSSSLLNALVIQPCQVSMGRVENPASYQRFIYLLYLLLTFAALFFAIVIPFIPVSELQLYRPLVLGIALMFPGFLLQDFFRKMFLAQNQPGYALVIDSLAGTGRLISLGLLYYFQIYRLGDALFYISLAGCLGLIPGFIFFRPGLPNKSDMLFWLPFQWKQAKWLVGTAFIQWWSGNLFVVASGLFLGVTALGAFRLIQSLFGLLNVALQTFENYALPQATRIYVQSPDEAGLYIRRISVKALFGLGIVMVLIFIFSESFIVLAGGPAYAEYGFLVKGMSLLYLLIFLGAPVRMAIRMLLLNRDFFIGYVLTLVFSLLSFDFLLSNWNLTGAVAGLAGSQILLLVYWQFVLVKNRFRLWR